jgi:hypothetical protein
MSKASSKLATAMRGANPPLTRESGAASRAVGSDFDEASNRRRGGLTNRRYRSIVG